MATLIEIRVPDLGDYRDVEIIEVAVAPGDTVAVEDTLITLETEKATMDVPSTAAGVLRELVVERGGIVSEGDLIAVVEGEPQADGQAEEADSEKVDSAQPMKPAMPSSRPAVAPRPETQSTPTLQAGRPPVDEPGFARAHASPSIRRFARELGVDLSRVSGTGHKGRIVENDVKAFVKRLLSEPAAGALPATR